MSEKLLGDEIERQIKRIMGPKFTPCGGCGKRRVSLNQYRNPFYKKK